MACYNVHTGTQPLLNDISQNVLPWLSNAWLYSKLQCLENNNDHLFTSRIYNLGRAQGKGSSFLLATSAKVAWRGDGEATSKMAHSYSWQVSADSWPQAHLGLRVRGLSSCPYRPVLMGLSTVCLGFLTTWGLGSKRQKVEVIISWDLGPESDTASQNLDLRWVI